MSYKDMRLGSGRRRAPITLPESSKFPKSAMNHLLKFINEMPSYVVIGEELGIHPQQVGLWVEHGIPSDHAALVEEYTNGEYTLLRLPTKGLLRRKRRGL